MNITPQKSHNNEGIFILISNTTEFFSVYHIIVKLQNRL